MAIYREGYAILEQYQKQEVRIWNDACDTGVPVDQGDTNWDLFKQLVDTYKVDGTRQVLSTGQVQIEVKLIDEWAVSDERKTVEQATERFTVLYYKFNSAERRSQNTLVKYYDGFISITKIN